MKIKIAATQMSCTWEIEENISKAKKLIYDFKKDRPKISRNSMNVTGGMTRKITEASKMAKAGMKVFFVNGNKPQRIFDAVSGKKFEGTVFRS